MDVTLNERRRTQRYARVAVIIPCRDEGRSIAGVVAQFRRSLPGAKVFVCDNGSSDRTAELAAAAGAIVVTEPRRGKGHAVRALLRAAEAEVYVMADGDDTYPAGAAPRLVRPVLDGEADVVVGTRWHKQSRSTSGRVRRVANLVLCAAFRALHGGGLTDVLSGYRAFSRRFAKDVLPMYDGFEVEVEMCREADSRGWSVAERRRSVTAGTGQPSKIRFVRDGLRILRAMMSPGWDEKREMKSSSERNGEATGICAVKSTAHTFVNR
jgi:glycosyltransferase involved in cell wall biosynthesis